MNKLSVKYRQYQQQRTISSIFLSTNIASIIFSLLACGWYMQNEIDEYNCCSRNFSILVYDWYWTTFIHVEKRWKVFDFSRII